MVSVEQIQGLECFAKLDRVQQKTLTEKSSRDKITHGVNVSKNIGFHRWVEINHPTQKIKQAVSELLTLNL